MCAMRRRGCAIRVGRGSCGSWGCGGGFNGKLSELLEHNYNLAKIMSSISDDTLHRGGDKLGFDWEVDDYGTSDYIRR
jgi:hypothetical protein